MERKEIKDEIIGGFSVGITVGVFISLFINAILQTDYFSLATPSMLKHFSSNWASFINVICYGLIGVGGTMTSKILTVKKLSLKVRSLLHFLSVQLIIFLVGLVLGWLNYYLMFVLPISIVVYLMFYLSFYFHKKKEVEVLNKALNQRKQS